ncbi:T9SS type A sorting domain-containing protein [Carboxylicivirga sp. M1479]|uniref:T9SS type A sorting domain-containing protein n=1 Tax=Carboxylicivirga sp. M1479 TaxID=2594476 RepID=UPI001177E76A|nr:T9SS type A sorting domain-containing protein [Carboxylicivirga sp. M1479]TRX72017.1 T9SS type A sorting domain-containing protein [Carboxylicivirga sp. M1479]
MNRILLLASLLLICASAFAQLSITTINQADVITFDQTLDGINNGIFNASGFSPSPNEGQLDSDGLIITGFSDGDVLLGETKLDGDFARGASEGGVGTGGIYAFKVAENDYALGLQPGGTDLTPGDIIIKIINNTGGVVNSIDISYDIYEYNDQNRSCSVNLSTSENSIDYTPKASTDYLTQEVAEATPTWIKQEQNLSQNQNIPNSATFYLKFTIDDAGGSGSRDEIAIDNISIRFNDTPTSITSPTLSTCSIVPHPVKEFFTFNSDKTVKHLMIYDTTGQIVKQIDERSKQIVVPVSALSKGIYLLHVTFEDNSKACKKIVIQ